MRFKQRTPKNELIVGTKQEETPWSHTRSAYPVGTIAALSLLLRAFAAIGTEMGEFSFAGDATNLRCLVLAPFASKQIFRIKQVGGSSAVTETATTGSKAIILLQCTV
jgi:hypothetical protein